MPVYNEAATLPRVLRELGGVRMNVPWELIVVDDGSTDGGVDLIEREWLKDADRVRVVRARRNQGKGAALRRGFALADGDILGVQDADLEYDPNEIPRVIDPIVRGDASVAFGSRQFGSHASYSFWYVMGNRAISLCASAMFDRYVTDVYTGYKFFRRDCYEQLRLSAAGFEIEAELTAGLLKTGATLFEVPITYRARSRAEGKKIRPRDGVAGLGRLARQRLLP
jgi:glycosyltransferase involved in cell wall biosynthesis